MCSAKLKWLVKVFFESSSPAPKSEVTVTVAFFRFEVHKHMSSVLAFQVRDVAPSAMSVPEISSVSKPLPPCKDTHRRIQ